MDGMMNAAWRARDTLAIRDQWARIELTLAWVELDRLLTHEVLVFSPRGQSPLWKALAVPCRRGVQRNISLVPSNALKVAAQGNPKPGFTSAHVRAAKALLVGSMLPYQQDVQA
jgi:hypothetical protein